MSLTKDLLGTLAVPQTDFMLDYDPQDHTDRESFLLDDDYGEHGSAECRMCNIVIDTIYGYDMCSGCRDATDW